MVAPLNSNTKNYKIGDVTQDSCSVYPAEPRGWKEVSQAAKGAFWTDFLKKGFHFETYFCHECFMFILMSM